MVRAAARGSSWQPVLTDRPGAGQQLGDCTGDANRYGMSDQGKGWGVPGDCTDPGLEHRYGRSTP